MELNIQKESQTNTESQPPKSTTEPTAQDAKTAASIGQKEKSTNSEATTPALSPKPATATGQKEKESMLKPQALSTNKEAQFAAQKDTKANGESQGTKPSTSQKEKESMPKPNNEKPQAPKNGTQSSMVAVQKDPKQNGETQPPKTINEQKVNFCMAMWNRFFVGGWNRGNPKYQKTNFCPIFLFLQFV